MKGLVFCVAVCLVCVVLCPYPSNGLDHPTAKRKVGAAIASRAANNPRRVWRVKNVRLDAQSETDENKGGTGITTGNSGLQKDKPKSVSDGNGNGNGNRADTSHRTEARTAAKGSTGISSPVKLLLQRFWNRLDAMDKMIVGNTLPLVGLTAIVPLCTGADLFWVNQLGDPLAVAAQSASNTVYGFAFGLFSFLPSVTATLVSKNYASNDLEETENIIITAFYFGLMACTVMSVAIFTNPSRYLGAVVKDGSPALALSEKYMRIRSLSLIPQMITYVCFSAFRGMLIFKPCIKITVAAAAINVALTPLLIHVFKFGILGSAISVLLCDSLAAISYMKLMTSIGFLSRKKLFRFPSWNEVLPMVKGTSLQARSLAMQFTNLMVARHIQSLDDTGVAPAAFSLAMQTFFIGGVVIWALGMSTQTLYPTSVAKCREEERVVYVQSLIKRLLMRGFGVGTTISCIQALLIPFILRSTPNIEVRQAAFFPILVVVACQGMQGMVSVGEGIMVGDGKFSLASIVIVVASIGYLGCLELIPKRWGINGVFIALGCFTLLRLSGFAVFLPSIINHHALTPTTPAPRGQTT